MIFVASPGVSYCTRALFASYAANQLVSSTTDGVTTRYAYDAAGRMVREGNKTYRYGYLDKVLSVTDGDTTRTFTYHADGQLASASLVGTGASPVRNEPETFQWDGLALIQRGDEQFINEPHVGGGNPVASSKGTSYFNDALGTTVGSKSNGKYSAAALTAFGENLSVGSPTPTQNSNFFTGKPYVEGLGHAFWMRNYRAGLAKWQTADPMGYPDGWNQHAYCGNGVTSVVDLWGCKKKGPHDLESKYIKWSHEVNGAWFFEVEITAICSGNFDNLTISHTIRRSDASWISFGAPIDEWQNGDDGKKIHIKDLHARYSNLTWVVKNVDDPPAKLASTKLASNGQKTKTYSVEVELWCTVEASYTTTVTVDGETITYEDKGQLQFLLKTDTVKFECTHSKHAE